MSNATEQKYEFGGMKSSSGFHIANSISIPPVSLPNPIIGLVWDNAGGYVPEEQGISLVGAILAGSRTALYGGVIDPTAFTGATGLSIVSAGTGNLGTVTVVSGKLVFDYITPMIDPDTLTVSGTDAYGRTFSIAWDVSLPY